MSAVTHDSKARQWADRLERREALRSGVSIERARVTVARRVGATPGMLETLGRNRIKGVRTWLFFSLRAALVDELTREIAAHQHELDTLLALGRGPDDGTLQEVEAGLAKLRGLLGAARARARAG